MFPFVSLLSVCEVVFATRETRHVLPFVVCDGQFHHINYVLQLRRPGRIPDIYRCSNCRPGDKSRHAMFSRFMFTDPFVGYMTMGGC
jgi:hypothetical protein